MSQEIHNDERPFKMLKRMHVVKNHGPVVLYADELDFKKHVSTRIFNDKRKGFRLVKLQVSTQNTNPIIIQFGNVKGRIPKKFGVDTNKHGKTNLTFNVPCEKEYSSLLEFQKQMKEFAKQSKSEWWNYEVTDNQIEDNFYNLITVDRKEKEDGTGLWPGSMKVSIPMKDDGQLQNVTIVDENDEKVSYYDLPGREWDTIIIELSGIFFQNKYSWGFGPKKLRYIKLAPDRNENAENIDFSNIVLPNKRSSF